MGGGLVLFGIGGATSGGLFDAINGNSSGGGSSDATEAIERTATTAQAATVANPKDAAAWARLVKARFQLAGADEGVDANGNWTAAGKKRLVPVEQAWDRYVALEPDPPDDTVAGYMVQAFSPTGLDKPDKAVARAGDDHRRARRHRRDAPRGRTSTRSSPCTRTPPTRCARATSRPTRPCRCAAESERKLLRQNLDNAKAQAVQQQASRPRRHRSRRRRAPRSTTG